jgi:hypothetical protein
MEEVFDKIPVSLHEKLSNELVTVILATEEKNSFTSNVAKKIIYLWRQDQLSTPAGIRILLDAAVRANSGETYMILDELGLEEVKATIKVRY